MYLQFNKLLNVHCALHKDGKCKALLKKTSVE